MDHISFSQDPNCSTFFRFCCAAFLSLSCSHCTLEGCRQPKFVCTTSLKKNNQLGFTSIWIWPIRGIYLSRFFLPRNQVSTTNPGQTQVFHQYGHPDGYSGCCGASLEVFSCTLPATKTIARATTTGTTRVSLSLCGVEKEKHVGNFCSPLPPPPSFWLLVLAFFASGFF